MNGPKFRRIAKALHANLGEDVVALQVERGQCFGMEQVTADVWRLLEQEMALAELCEQLIAQYDVDEATCHAEVAELLKIMEDEGLVETVI